MLARGLQAAGGAADPDACQGRVNTNSKPSGLKFMNLRICGSARRAPMARFRPALAAPFGAAHVAAQARDALSTPFQKFVHVFTGGVTGW
jgi:hypothetical protein